VGGASTLPSRAGRTTGGATRGTVPSSRGRPWLGAAVVAAFVLAIGGAVWAWQMTSGGELQGPAGASATIPSTIGTAVGDLAPAFTFVDLDGTTVTRDSLRGRPAVLWFTASYCVPCQEGALTLRRLLGRIGAENRLAVVMVFVDPGETRDSLVQWKSRFGAPDWKVGFTTARMFTDYRVRYLDTKYLLDQNGVIRVADFSTLQEGPWEQDLRAVIGG
jgi:cytochrome oxidase Cu insertion factor (SCO1/SenC/PrrC family)